MVEKQRYLRGHKNAVCVWMLTVLVCLFLGVGVSAEKAQAVVLDAAELFTAYEMSQLEGIAGELADEYEMNVCVLTVDEAFGMSSAELAEYFYEENGFVDNGSRGGIVLLIDMDNREINLVTSRDMIYYITDSREEAIYDSGYACVAEGEYGLGMQKMLEQTAYFLAQGLPGNQYTYDTETGQIVRNRSLSAADWLIAAVGAAAAAGFACFGVCNSYGKVKAYEYSAAGNAKISLTGEDDQLVNRFVTRRRIPRMPPPGMSGRSGGGGRSSTHRSSRGNTFGGGSGRKF